MPRQSPIEHPPSEPRVAADLRPIPGWTPKPNGGQQIAHHPTDDSRLLVEMLTGFGATQNEIADVLDIQPHDAGRALPRAAHARRAQSQHGGRQQPLPHRHRPERRHRIRQRRDLVDQGPDGLVARRAGVSADVRTVNANVRDLTDEQLLEIIDQRHERSSGGALPSPETSRGNFTEWCRFAGFEPASHHLLLCGELEALSRGETERLAMFLPPGSAKCTYAACCSRPGSSASIPTRPILATSHTYELAEHWGRRARNLVESTARRSAIEVDPADAQRPASG